MSLNNSTYTQSLGIPFTQYVTSSAGHALISSSTYFNDTSDNLPRYKDADGNVLVPFVSSSYAVTASYALNGGADTNFANTDLIFTANRSHNTDGNDLFISVDGNFGTTTVTDAFLGIQAAELTLGFSQSAQTQYVGDGITHTGNTIISGSLTSTGLTEGAGTNTVAMYDTGSGQFFYTASSAIGGGGSDTNFANTDLTFTADRNHDSNGFDFIVTADSGGFANAYLGYNFSSFMGLVTTSSFIGVENTYIQTVDQLGAQSIRFFAENTSSMIIYGGVAGGVDINNNSLFVSTVTDNVSIGKNTSNAKLDVNGDTIITGSLTANGSITASSDISSSGTVFGVTGSFSHLVGNSPITVGDAITFQQPITASVVSGSFEGDGGELTLTQANFGQTQWGRTLTASVNLPDGTTANGFEFFTDADKVTDGTTTYDEYFVGYGNDMTLTGTSGTALINISGSDYPISFDTTLQTTADNFVAASSSILLSLYDISVNSPGSNILRFGNGNQTTIDNITITNQTGNLSGTLVGAVNNHVRIPYVGTAYEGQRLTHNFRVNFNIEPGSTQTLALSLRRFTDDTIIGSELPVLRNADEPGNQFNFNSYTAGAADPFVQGGFYFALRNDSGTNSIDISGSVGILIQTYYQYPTKF